MKLTKEAEQYYHFLYDTLILLGAGERFASLVEHPELILQEDIDDLRNYNCKLIDSIKDKLINIHKIEIKVEK